ncbi:MAG TPA: hypothetical protein VGK14_00095 [Novimethylophilus sp.]|jgi:hypothetical protein|uniref:hypothetical protein n=1 Tax=Novimethylophilus sp. TaxID=2137426 RepID=UPI002F3FEFBD
MKVRKVFASFRGSDTDFKKKVYELMSQYGKVRSLEVLTVDPRPDRRLLVIFDRESDALVAAASVGGTRLGLSGVKLTV